MKFELDSFEQMPTRRQIIDTYLSTFTERDQTYLIHIQDQIKTTDTPLAATQVIIPVAAHQEAKQLPTALEQYALQTTDQPFSVILGLNTPYSQQDNPGISASLLAIAAARQAHPHLDLRVALTFYDKPSIGTIRRDLWNASLLQSLEDGLYDSPTQEVIGLNHDIDTVSMSPRYMQRVQAFYSSQQARYQRHGIQHAPHAPRTSRIKHATSPGHPVISKAIFWSDYTVRNIGESFEAGAIIPLSHYALSGGFRADARTHETRSILKDMPLHHTISGTVMQTSPRRYIDRIHHGFQSIWTEDSFGDNDECRLSPIRPDMSMQELEQAMLDDNFLRKTIADMASVAIHRRLCTHNSSRYLEDPNDSASGLENFTATLESAGLTSTRRSTVVLARVVQSDALTRQALELQTDDEYRRQILRRYIATDED